MNFGQSFNGMGVPGGLLGMGMSGTQPPYTGLFTGLYQPPQSSHEQMAAPYAQWAAQQLQAVAPQTQMQQVAQPVRRPGFSPQELLDYYGNSSYNNS